MDRTFRDQFVCSRRGVAGRAARSGSVWCQASIAGHDRAAGPAEEAPRVGAGRCRIRPTAHVVGRRGGLGWGVPAAAVAWARPDPAGPGMGGVMSGRLVRLHLGVGAVIRRLRIVSTATKGCLVAAARGARGDGRHQAGRGRQTRHLVARLPCRRRESSSWPAVGRLLVPPRPRAASRPWLRPPRPLPQRHLRVGRRWRRLGRRRPVGPPPSLSLSVRIEPDARR